MVPNRRHTPFQWENNASSKVRSHRLPHKACTDVVLVSTTRCRPSCWRPTRSPQSYPTYSHNCSRGPTYRTPHQTASHNRCSPSATVPRSSPRRVRWSRSLNLCVCPRYLSLELACQVNWEGGLSTHTGVVRLRLGWSRAHSTLHYIPPRFVSRGHPFARARVHSHHAFMSYKSYNISLWVI